MPYPRVSQEHDPSGVSRGTKPGRTLFRRKNEALAARKRWRNGTIKALQGTRNRFIDQPGLADGL